MSEIVDMHPLQPLDFMQWIEANRAAAAAAGGQQSRLPGRRIHRHGGRRPQRRKDFHVDPAEEFFYQLEGDMSAARGRGGRYSRAADARRRDAAAAGAACRIRRSATPTRWAW